MNGNDNEGKTPRKRSLTEITLGWIAEKLRRSEEIKSEIEKGTYKVDTNKVATSIISRD